MDAAMIDDKYGELFRDALIDAGLQAQVIEAETTHRAVGHIVRATVAIPDVADWTLRYTVLNEARLLEQEWGISVVCLFRPSRAEE